MASMGFQPVGNTSAECAAHIGTEAAKWARVIREAGIKVR
jgi:tripartite-type tricarboxylate transporter receptor subunit TctC